MVKYIMICIHIVMCTLKWYSYLFEIPYIQYVYLAYSQNWLFVCLGFMAYQP